MHLIEEVRVIDDGTIRWVAVVEGRRVEWDAESTDREQAPGRPELGGRAAR